MSTKICPGCKRDLPLASFSKDKYRADGLRRKCKGCSTVEFAYYATTDRYKVRLDKQKAQRKKLKEENPIKRWAYMAFHNAKARAKKLNLEFTLTKVWLEETAPTVCPLLNIELVYNADKSVENTASIDRKDSTKGYTIDNCKIISFKANRMKSNATVSELRLLVQNMKDY